MITTTIYISCFLLCFIIVLGYCWYETNGLQVWHVLLAIAFASAVPFNLFIVAAILLGVTITSKWFQRLMNFKFLSKD